MGIFNDLWFGRLGDVAVAVNGLALAWITWYSWKFFLSPRFRPDEPKELPYWIPYLGHVVGMARNTHEVFSRGRNYFGDTREPFTVTVMGESMYILTSPNDVSAVYKLPKELDFNPFIKDTLVIIGVPESAVEKMFEPRFGNGKTWMDTSHENFRLQMHPGDRLDSVQERMINYCDNWLRWDKVSGDFVLSRDETGEKTVSLYKWAREVLVNANSRAFYDESLFKLAPDLMARYYVFEASSWKLPYKLPEFMDRDMFDAKRYAEGVLERYLQQPSEKRAGEAWIISQIDRDTESLGISIKERVPAFFSFFNLINTNAFKQAFWLLAYIMFDPVLLAQIRTEIDSAFSTSESFSITPLIESCPLLNSAYQDCLRLTNWPIGTRSVTAPCIIGGRRLRPGLKLLMPFQQMHSQRSVFGTDAADFSADRFLKNPSLSRAPGFRPFGGGVTHCPGRFLARREVLVFVAMVLRRFDLELKDGLQAVFPRLDDSVTIGGVMVPKPGDDVLLRVKERTVAA